MNLGSVATADSRSHGHFSAEGRLPRSGSQAENGNHHLDENLRDMHLSAHEPRYIPGLVTSARASRGSSLVPDGEDVASTSRKGNGKEDMA